MVLDDQELQVGSALRRSLSQHVDFAAAEAGKKIPMKKMSVLMASASLDDEIMADEDKKPIYIVAFLYFKSPLNKKKVQDLIKERLFEIPRFHSKIANEKKGKKDNYFFQKMNPDNIPMDTMVRESDIKTQAQVDELVSKMNAERFEPGLPLWRAYIANNMSDGRSLLMWQIDHSIGDGPALISALMAILDDHETAEAVPTPKPKKRAVGCWTPFRIACGACLNVVIGDNCIPPDPPSKLKVKNHRKPGVERAVSLSKGLDLQRMKEVKNMYEGATLNDVLLANVCLTLREYYLKYEPTVIEKKQKFRANFPISIRSKSEEANMTSVDNFGNRFSSGICSFPIHIEDPVEMVVSIKKQIDKIKLSPEPIIRDKLVGVLAGSSMKKADIMNLVLDMYGKVSAMLSNVPGPQKTVFFGGQAIDDISFYALAPIGLYFGIVSYQGKISCGIAVSKECEPNATNLSSLWGQAFDKLHNATMDRAKAGPIKTPGIGCCG